MDGVGMQTVLKGDVGRTNHVWKRENNYNVAKDNLKYGTNGTEKHAHDTFEPSESGRC